MALQSAHGTCTDMQDIVLIESWEHETCSASILKRITCLVLKQYFSVPETQKYDVVYTRQAATIQKKQTQKNAVPLALFNKIGLCNSFHQTIMVALNQQPMALTFRHI